jgi:shikimate kinase
MNKKNIVLIGLMGAGKTTIGKMLSQKLETEYVDIDTLIERESKKTINKIFEMYGEVLFRKLEAKAIKKISKYSNQIISTGGGAVETPENLENFKKNSILVYLYAPPEELYKRIKDDHNRPLLKTGNPLQTMQKLFKKRQDFYNQADIKIETVNKKSYEIVDEIIEKCQKYECSSCNS